MSRLGQPESSLSDSPRWGRLLALNILLGACLGWLLLHPLTMIIYSLDYQKDSIGPPTSWWRMVRSLFEFTPAMLAMSAIFAFVGGAAGFAFATFHRLLFVRERTLGLFKSLAVGDLPSLIAAGESEKVEFKRSVRWDAERQCVNRALEQPATRALAGFLNHRGGSLVVGVADDGTVVGLEEDYRTLKRPDRDGFEQFIVGLVKRRLGGDVCLRVHVTFGRLEGKEVCRIVAESSSRPVYCREGQTTTLFVRMGNSTQALDVQEAIEYSMRRWPSPD